jgi:hypothetical protein
MSDLLDGGMGAAREKFKKLATMQLEWIENEELAKEWKERGGKQDDLPFFSEMALYSLLGKDNARTVLALLHQLGESLGFSRVEQDREFKKPKRAAKDLPDQDDIDGLECILRDEAIFLLGSEPGKKILPFMRALSLMREIVGAREFRDGVEYLQLHPKDIRIGDRIANHGRWIEVLGFFTKKGKPSDKPVPDRLTKDDKERGRTEPYWGAHVKTRESDTHGWPIRTQDRYIVQRKKAEEAA